MGAYDLILHAAQEGRIGDLNDRIEELEKKVELLYEWVMYLKEQNDSKS
jgi:hypothetical protein